MKNKKTLRQFMEERLGVEAFDAPTYADVALAHSSQSREIGRYDDAKDFAVLGLELGAREVGEKFLEREHFVLFPIDGIPSRKLSDGAHVYFCARGYRQDGSLKVNDTEATYVFARDENEPLMVVSLTRTPVREKSALFITSEPIFVEKNGRKTRLRDKLVNFVKDESGMPIDVFFNGTERGIKKGVRAYKEHVNNPEERTQMLRLLIYATATYAALC